MNQALTYEMAFPLTTQYKYRLDALSLLVSAYASEAALLIHAIRTLQVRFVRYRTEEFLLARYA